MTKMNLSLEQNQEQRDQTGDCQGGGVWGRDEVGG